MLKMISLVFDLNVNHFLCERQSLHKVFHFFLLHLTGGSAERKDGSPSGQVSEPTESDSAGARVPTQQLQQQWAVPV